jgi:homoaconitase/3-isopropylmalate dehydratase large subunit
MGKTMTAKILARASGQDRVDAGDTVLARVGVLALSDANRFIELFRQQKLKAWDPKRIIFSFDHFLQPEWWDLRAELEHPKIHAFAKEQGIPPENLYEDPTRRGISHHIPVEQGWALPGSVSIAADTQAAMMGAANCFSFPAMYAVDPIVLTGDVWVTIPECVEVTLTGALARGVTGKDVAYHVMRALSGKVDSKVIEYAGPGVATMSVDVRMAVANGAMQTGALTVVFPCDEVLLDYFEGRAREPFEPAIADADADYVARYAFDLSAIEPLVAGPHEIELIRPLSEVVGQHVDAVYIGSCSSGRLSDLALAAEVLRGRKASSQVRLVVTPVSGDVAREAEAGGLLKIFTDAGAIVTTPGCGACYAANLSPLKLDDGERCFSTSVETNKGRMGSLESEVLLGNAAVAAATAIEGRIASPQPYLMDTREDLA